jgi:hypothetical protein
MQASGNTSRLLLVLAIGTAVVAAFFVSPRETLSQGTTAITGYAWSDTIGWVSLNCSDLGTCGTSNYGLAIGADGTISGYAWSENVGWISANSADLAGCPTAPCTARMDELSMEGWMKAVNGGQADSGGWDGFISLSGSNYGPTLSEGAISGYAWGDTNIGWLSFSSAQHSAETSWLPACALSYVCTDSTHRQNSCAGAPVEACAGSLVCTAGACVLPPAPSTPGGGELTVSPRLVRIGGSVTVSWTVSDATSCTVTENSGDINDSWTGVTSAASTCTHNGAGCRTSGITGTTIYTLSCTGPGGDLTQNATVFSNPSWKEL